MTITVHDIEKSFGRYPALNGVSLEIAEGELLALLALVTLVAKSLLEWRYGDELAASARH